MRMPRLAAPVILAATLVVALLGALATLTGSSPAAPAPAAGVSTVLPGDDNGDGRIEEDESGFKCATMGNGHCGTIRVRGDLPTGTVVAVPLECQGAPARVLTLCATVEAQHAYTYRPQGARKAVHVAAGPELLATIARDGLGATDREFGEVLAGVHAAYLVHTGQTAPECRGAADFTALCMLVYGQPAYGWDTPGGDRVDNPAGPEQIRDLDVKPADGPAFAAALRALRDEYRQHAA
ncbi:hypothetical protein ACIP9H_33355 [Streptomyces sp. NPDC088732]|uniref:hypothetical protein n=1 Tax=Streptomyces sp. NPDC088732 TaxID=3365879 RepID=UPI0037FA04E0